MTVILVDGNQLEIKEISLNEKLSNVKQFKVVLYTLDNEILEEQTSKLGKKIIPIKTTEKVSKIKITIIKTTDDLPPRFVELSVKACDYPTSTFKSTTPSSSMVSSTSSLFSTLSTRRMQNLNF